MKISVALSTFNGEPYLYEQLQSLVDQVRIPDELVVGDDGSTDSTISILEEFRSRAPFPVFIHQNKHNLGFGRNFLATAKRCKGDWVAFCDQDDVWLPDKLAQANCAIEGAPECSIVLQNAFLCDGKLTVRGRKFPDMIRTGIYERSSQYGFWVWLGCLQTVRREVIDLWDEGSLPKNYFPDHQEYSHDKWTCMIANAIGGIIVCDEPVALYRRHEAALTGSYSYQSPRDRVAKARSVKGEHYGFLAEVAEECGSYIERLSQRVESPSWVSLLRNNRAEFQKLGEIQRLRAELYASPRVDERLLIALKIARRGGYVGPRFYSMGLLSAAKDLARVARGPML